MRMMIKTYQSGRWRKLMGRGIKRTEHYVVINSSCMGTLNKKPRIIRQRN